MQKQKKTAQDRLNFWWGLYTLASLLAMAVCAIVDRAMGPGLTWSLVPLSCIVFAWGILTPLMLLRRHRLMGALLALTGLIMPFLIFLNRLAPALEWAWPVAFPIVAVSLGVLWLALLLFRYTQLNKWVCTGLVALSTLVINPVVHEVLNRYDGTPIPATDSLNLLATGCLALACFTIGLMRAWRKRRAA